MFGPTINQRKERGMSEVPTITLHDGVEIPQQHVDELRWVGTPRQGWEAFCASLGLDQFASRPHRWLA